MPRFEQPTTGLRGKYRDVLRDPGGQVVWDRGWRGNVIAADFRRVLAGFVHGAPTGTAGIEGLWVGAGQASWDSTNPPPPDPAQQTLVDPYPYLVPRASLQLDYLDAGAVSPTPTNRLQIEANLGPGVPPWPDANHVTGSLREFGLVCRLDGALVLLNYVTHRVIAKDPASTLERTIWLVF